MSVLGTTPQPSLTNDRGTTLVTRPMGVCSCAVCCAQDFEAKVEELAQEQQQQQQEEQQGAQSPQQSDAGQQQQDQEAQGGAEGGEPNWEVPWPSFHLLGAAQSRKWVDACTAAGPVSRRAARRGASPTGRCQCFP